MSNPFQPIPKDKKPKVAEVDRNTDEDKYIITYGVVQHVRSLGDKDTDFVIDDIVEELDRVNRQDYVESFRDDVGILNIIEKVRLSGDQTLLNQVHRVSMPSVGKDALGHDVEEVVDVTRYQVDKTEALEAYKVGAAAFDSLDPELKKKMTLEQVAKMTDEEIDSFLSSRLQQDNQKEGK